MIQGFIYTFKWYRAGRLLDQWQQHNSFVDQGVESMLAAVASGGVPSFNGLRLLDAPLIDGDPVPVAFNLDQTDTNTTHPGWREVGGYTNNNAIVARPTWKFFPPPTGNSSAMTHDDPFTPTGSNNNGVFKFTKSQKAMAIGAGKLGLTGDPGSPPAQDSGPLFSTAAFDPSGRRISFRNGDILAVDYTFLVTGSQGTVSPIVLP